MWAVGGTRMRPSLLLLLLLLLLVTRPLTRAEEVQLEVVRQSSECSVTCGLGVKTQTVCLVNDPQTAMEDGGERAQDGEALGACRRRVVACRETWRCGLRTLTVAVGQRLEEDCVGRVAAELGRFSWRVSWRYARGVISSDDSLFARWEAPDLDRLLLDPVREQHAGTYRCDVQDAALRRVKTQYWGVRVVPAGILDLDYDRAGTRWELSGNRTQAQTKPMELPRLVLTSLSVALPLAVLVLLGLMWTSKRRDSHLRTQDEP